MSSSKIVNLILVIVLFAVIVGAGYYWYQSYPTDDQIKAKQKGIEPVDKTVFQSQAVKLLAGRDRNGQIPVIITPEDIGKPDPFAQ